MTAAGCLPRHDGVGASPPSYPSTRSPDASRRAAPATPYHGALPTARYLQLGEIIEGEERGSAAGMPEDYRLLPPQFPTAGQPPYPCQRFPGVDGV